MDDDADTREIIIHAYIATRNIAFLGKNTLAYGLLVHSPKKQSWHWGVKNREDQWVDMEMFGLKRVLLAISTHNPDQALKLVAFMKGASLSSRLFNAAKTKRDIESGIENNGLIRNRSDWLETVTLWDIYKKAMREARTEQELSYLNLALQNIKKEEGKIPLPLKSNFPFLESPEQVVFE